MQVGKTSLETGCQGTGVSGRLCSAGRPRPPVVSEADTRRRKCLPRHRLTLFMLIPQYSIRWMLMLTAVCGAIFSVFGLAVRGNMAALGVSLAIVALVLALLANAAMFALVWLFSVVTDPMRRQPTVAGQSPFAPGTKPGPDGESSPVDDKDVPAAPIITE